MYRKLFDFRFDFKNNKNVTNLNENTKYCYETIFRQIDILSSKNCTLRLLINIKKNNNNNFVFVYIMFERTNLIVVSLSIKME